MSILNTLNATIRQKCFLHNIGLPKARVMSLKLFRFDLSNSLAFIIQIES